MLELELLVQTLQLVGTVAPVWEGKRGSIQVRCCVRCVAHWCPFSEATHAGILQLPWIPAPCCNSAVWGGPYMLGCTGMARREQQGAHEAWGTAHLYRAKSPCLMPFWPLAVLTRRIRSSAKFWGTAATSSAGCTAGSIVAVPLHQISSYPRHAPAHKLMEVT